MFHTNIVCKSIFVRGINSLQIQNVLYKFKTDIRLKTVDEDEDGTPMPK